MAHVGKAPIRTFWFITGKLSFAVCALYFLVPRLACEYSLYVSPLTAAMGSVLFWAGCLVLCLAIMNLGASTYMGLPEEKTELQTSGLYRFSRNPIYLGLFAMCTGSCLYTVHPINLACAIVSIFIHHRIVLAEERFLESRFGDAWRTYQSKVRRYL